MSTDSKWMVAIVAIVILLPIMVAVVGRAIKYYCVDNVPVTCFVDGVEVFDGRSACIDVNSSGANTTITVNGGPLCLFPKAYYVSNNVVLHGRK